MYRKRIFFIFILTAMAGMTIWARGRSVDLIPDASIATEANAPSPYLRRKVLETLDRIVTYEHYYKAVYGSFTRIAGRLGVPISEQVEDAYEIRVLEASGERLLVSALSEAGGRVSDYVVIDHQYRVRANFTLPEPDPAYLTQLATKHVRAMLSVTEGSEVREKGMFQGYFGYEIEKDTRGNLTVTATGLRAPVEGVRINSNELQAGAMTSANVRQPEPRTGQRATHDVVTSMQETYLAQRIFRGETGRYAKTWEELSRIADFRFDDKPWVDGRSGEIPFGDRAIEIDLKPRREPAQTTSNAVTILPTSSLEIEPIDSDGPSQN